MADAAAHDVLRSMAFLQGEIATSIADSALDRALQQREDALEAMHLVEDVEGMWDRAAPGLSARAQKAESRPLFQTNPRRR